jgi:hypothetical protein
MRVPAHLASCASTISKPAIIKDTGSISGSNIGDFGYCGEDFSIHYASPTVIVGIQIFRVIDDILPFFYVLSPRDSPHVVRSS